jgi:hypothetical protein
MPDFLLLMHALSPGVAEADWGPYLARLGAAGALRGGSSIGPGKCVRRQGAAPAITAHLTGFIRVAAADLDAVEALLPANPVYEAGGVVEIRALPEDE